MSDHLLHRHHVAPGVFRVQRARLAAVAALAALAVLPGTDTAVGAPLECQAPANLPPETMTAGPRHHPVGRPLPDQPTFHQPDLCDQGIWFYDSNGNRRPDADEPQLYGVEKLVACASCHAESPTPKSTASASVFLRQDAQSLCLVCHNL